LSTTTTTTTPPVMTADFVSAHAETAAAPQETHAYPHAHALTDTFGRHHNYLYVVQRRATAPFHFVLRLTRSATPRDVTRPFHVTLARTQLLLN
jgi:hypothetical protein